MTIMHLFRSPGTGHSIEAVFKSLRQALESQQGMMIRTICLPYVSRGLRSVWRNLRFVAGLKADVFHITGDVHYVVLALPPRRTVLTIHDCILLKMNRNRPIRYAFFWLFWYYLPIRRAAIVSVVSEKTRQELYQHVGSIAGKAQVIPNGYDPAFVYHPRRMRSKQPVLLQIGTAPHKNLSNLLVAIETLNCALVIVGPLFKAMVDELQNRRITYQHHVNLSRAAIIQLYTDCNIVTFISTYEGFGMPILEANAIGRPVITSNISPLRDLAAGAAHIVDPTDITAIRQGIERLINDTVYRQMLVDAGRVNARKYGATAVAEQYQAFYQQLDLQPSPELIP